MGPGPAVTLGGRISRTPGVGVAGKALLSLLVPTLGLLLPKIGFANYGGLVMRPPEAPGDELHGHS